MELITKLSDDRLDLYPLEGDKMLLLDSLRAALEREEAYSRSILKIKTLEAELAEALGQLCSARETLKLARTLNGTECGFHDERRKARRSDIERCGKCFYCVIDYIMTVHLSSAPCPHDAEAKRLREAWDYINKVMGLRRSGAEGKEGE